MVRISRYLEATPTARVEWVAGVPLEAQGRALQGRNHERIEVRLHQGLLRHRVLLRDQHMPVWVR